MVCAPAVVRQSAFMCFGGVTLVRALIGEVGFFSVGCFQNLATLAGFSNIAYQSFNSVTMPLTYKCTKKKKNIGTNSTFSIRLVVFFYLFMIDSQNSFQHP